MCLFTLPSCIVDGAIVSQLQAQNEASFVLLFEHINKLKGIWLDTLESIKRMERCLSSTFLQTIDVRNKVVIRSVGDNMHLYTDLSSYNHLFMNTPLPHSLYICRPLTRNPLVYPQHKYTKYKLRKDMLYSQVLISGMDNRGRMF